MPRILPHCWMHPRNPLVQWAHLLEDKGLAGIGRIVDKSFIYTEEGKEYLKFGLPETQLPEILP